MKADYHPQDRSIMLAEWLQYGVMRVPGLNDEIAKGQITATSESAERPKLVPGNNARGLFDTAGPGPTTGTTPGTTPAPGTPSTSATAAPSNASAVRLQRPSLFDFARARRDLVIVRTP